MQVLIFTPTDFTVLMLVIYCKYPLCHPYTLQDHYIAFGQVISILHLSFCSTLNSTEQYDFTHFLIVDFSLMHFLNCYFELVLCTFCYDFVPQIILIFSRSVILYCNLDIFSKSPMLEGFLMHLSLFRSLVISYD